MRSTFFVAIALVSLAGCSGAAGPSRELGLRSSDAVLFNNRNEVFVAVRNANRVLRFDSTTFSQVEPPLEGLASPEGVGLALDGVADTAYVSNNNTGTVNVFALFAGAVAQLATISGISGASGVAVDNRACELFVTGAGAVHVYDTRSLAFRPLAILGSTAGIVVPGGLAVDPGHGKLYVAQGNGNVKIFDTHHLDTPPQTIPGLAYPGGVAVDPVSERLYVTENYAGDVKSFVPSPNGYRFESVVATGLRLPFGDAYDPHTAGSSSCNTVRTTSSRSMPERINCSVASLA